MFCIIWPKEVSKSVEKMYTFAYLNPCFGQVDFHGQILASKYIRIVGLGKGRLQLLQLAEIKNLRTFSLRFMLYPTYLLQCEGGAISTLLPPDKSFIVYGRMIRVAGIWGIADCRKQEVLAT